MKTPDTPSAKSAKSALFTPPSVNADNADNAGELSAKINEARAAALTLTERLCIASAALGKSGYEAPSQRAMRQYRRAVDIYISLERDLENLP